MMDMLATLLLVSIVVLHGCSAGDRNDSYLVTIDTRPWISALGSDDLFDSEPAKDGLVALGPRALGALGVAMEREDAPVRLGIVEVLQEMGREETFALLARAARDPDTEVRSAALRALGKLGDQRGRDIIEAALEDSEVEPRDAAAAACARLCRSGWAARRLVALTLAEPSGYRMSRPRASLDAMLGDADDDRAAAARVAIAELALPVLEEGGKGATAAAFLAADIGNAGGVRILEAAAESRADPILRGQAIAALGTVGDAKSARLLGEIAASADPAARSLACQSLGELAKRGVSTESVGCEAQAERR